MEPDEIRDTIKNQSDEIERKYDEKINQMTPEEPEEIPKFETLNQKYIELKDKISSNRKIGKDVFIAENVLKSFSGKLAMAKATREQEDIMKAESILNEANRELEESLAKEEVDVRSEVNSRAKELIDETNRMINQEK